MENTNMPQKGKGEKEGKDPVVTAVSLIVIAIQSLIIILGYVNRWDWLAYECAAMLIIPALVVLCYGIKAVIEANRLMSIVTEDETTNDEN